MKKEQKISGSPVDLKGTLEISLKDRGRDELSQENVALGREREEGN